MHERVIRGTLHVDDHNLGEVVARFVDAGDIAGILILMAPGGRRMFPGSEWVSAWLAPIDHGPAVAIRVRCSPSGGLEFNERAPAAES